MLPSRVRPCVALSQPKTGGRMWLILAPSGGLKGLTLSTRNRSQRMGDPVSHWHLCIISSQNKHESHGIFSTIPFGVTAQSASGTRHLSQCAGKLVISCRYPSASRSSNTKPPKPMKISLRPLFNKYVQQEHRSTNILCLSPRVSCRNL